MSDIELFISIYDFFSSRLRFFFLFPLPWFIESILCFPKEKVINIPILYGYFKFPIKIKIRNVTGNLVFISHFTANFKSSPKLIVFSSELNCSLYLFYLFFCKHNSFLIFFYIYFIIFILEIVLVEVEMLNYVVIILEISW